MVTLDASYAPEMWNLFHNSFSRVTLLGKLGPVAVNGGEPNGWSLMILSLTLRLGWLSDAQRVWGEGGFPTFMQLFGPFGISGGTKLFFKIRMAGNLSWWSYGTHGKHGMRYGKGCEIK